MQEMDQLEFFLKSKIEEKIEQFPILFDHRLYEGLRRTISNSSSNFLRSRPLNHLYKILLTQFFLQKKMEASLQCDHAVQQRLFLKIFQYSSRIGIALCCHDSFQFQRDRLIKIIQITIPGIQEISNSFYLWAHPELHYMFCYIEVHKLRGEELSSNDLKKLQSTLQEQLLMTPSLTPALFWPYNEEESFRQVLSLSKEIQKANDPPQISIHFQEQTPASLEFLVHIARPQSIEPLNRSLENLPDYLDFFCYFQNKTNIHVPVEIGAFALKVPSYAFDVYDSINLLYARRYVIKILESTFGPCRDYNGGLFEKQQQHFETLRIHLSHKIPLFDFFAEKVFYALRPVEKRLTIALQDAEELFTTFSNSLQGKEWTGGKSQSENVIIIKALDSSKLPKMNHISKESKKELAYAQLYFAGYHYHCLITNGAENNKAFIPTDSRSIEKSNILRLAFEEGEPNSLNPYYSSSDMRSRLICKLLFEGLTRLDQQGYPELAGAVQCEVNEDKTIYTFKLRQNRWSNGESLTAIDYVSSIQQALTSHLSHPEIYFVIKNAQKFKEKQIEANQIGIRALDIDMLQFELEYSDPDFLKKLAIPFFFPLLGSIKEPKWFNGPYLLHEKTKEAMWLKRNPYFWNATSQFFEEIQIQWSHDINTIYKLFQEKKIDWVGDPLSSLPIELIKKLETEEKLITQNAARQFLIYFNTKNPILCSPKIRRALSLSIDRDLICNTIYPYSIPYSPSQPCKKEANLLFEQGLKELGLTRKEFPSLTFTYSHQARRDTLAACLIKSWQEILGITVNSEQLQWNFFRNRLEKRTFEICAAIQDVIDEDSPRYFEKYEGNSSWNFSSWTHDDYKKKIEKAKIEIDIKVRHSLLYDAKQILIDEAPVTPLLKYVHLFTHSANLKDYRFDDEGCVDFSSSRFHHP